MCLLQDQASSQATDLGQMLGVVHILREHNDLVGLAEALVSSAAQEVMRNADATRE